MKNTTDWQRDVVHIVLYVVGVLVFVTTAPDVVRAIISAVVGMSEETLESYYVHNRWVNLSTPLLQTIAGLLLARMSGSLAARVFPDRMETSSDEVRETSRV